MTMTSQPTGRAPSSDEDKALALDRLAKGMEIGMILCSSSNWMRTLNLSLFAAIFFALSLSQCMIIGSPWETSISLSRNFFPRKLTCWLPYLFIRSILGLSSGQSKTFLQLRLPWHSFPWKSHQVPRCGLYRINITSHICICVPI